MKAIQKAQAFPQAKDRFVFISIDWKMINYYYYYRAMNQPSK